MEKVIITLNRGSYDFMRKTLTEHRAFLYRIKMPELASNDLPAITLGDWGNALSSVALKLGSSAVDMTGKYYLMRSK